jgi:hypothetical protein
MTRKKQTLPRQKRFEVFRKQREDLDMKDLQGLTRFI